MSELINTNDKRATIRWKLLTGVSALALTAYVSSAGIAEAEDSDRPQVWIELGGQLERVDDAQAIFTPPFFAQAPASMVAPMVDAQLPLRYSVGEEGRLTFVPRDSNWVFSASIRYGRSNATRHLHHETDHPVVPQTSYGRPVTGPGITLDTFGDGQSRLDASHAIIDFQAGKDVGLGMFGAGSTSVLSVGVRFAQFTSSLNTTLHARPVYGSYPGHSSPGYYVRHNRFMQNNMATAYSNRSSQAVGPSLAWEASTPVVGNDSSMAVTFDWGLNAALLFGRQRAHVNHQTAGSYFRGFYAGFEGTVDKISSYAHGPYDHDRSRTVTIPNVGGFAGVSFRYLDAKLKFGYRGDFFFGATDGGIDTAKKENVGFYGPFATISIGFGG